MKKVAIIFLLAIVGVFGQFILQVSRPIKTPLVADSAIAALGGLRTLATEAIWFRAEQLQENGRYVELAQLATTLTFLEPHTPEVWSFAAWNLAYNVSIMMPTHADRWRWVLASLKLLRDDGLRLNPNEPEIYRELAWFFQIKIGTDLDAAGAYYREQWKAIVNDVASRDAWKELAMDKEKMNVIASKYEIRDWTNPQASALYWADEGMKIATGNNRAFLSDIIRNARIILERNGGAARNPAGGGL